jgi:putative transposase
MSRKRHRSGDKVCLAYTVALPRTVLMETGEVVELPERLRWMGRALLPWMNAGLAALHTEAILDLALTWEHQAWPQLRPWMPVQEGLPSRVARGAQEVVGRILVSQAARRQAFAVLRETRDGELERLLGQRKMYQAVLRARDGWETRHGEDAPATGYMLGVAEQLAADHRRRTETLWHGSTWADWAVFCGQPVPAPWASTYSELQRTPRMQRLFLTYAVDDGPDQGQACRYRLTEDGAALDVSLRVPVQPAPTKTKDWAWCQFRLKLPEKVREELGRGGRLRAPDLRQRPDGTWVLDLKVESVLRATGPWRSGRVLAFDWGLRKLVTAVVLEEGPSGWVQLTRPFFLKLGGLYAKLKELRAHASLLRGKADGRRNARRREQDPATRRALRQEQEKAEKEWSAVWRRFRELQRQIAHMASGLLVDLAVASGCSVIVGEWLGSLKSQEKGRDLNWRINSQVRAKILEHIRYKAKRAGIRVGTVWPRGTSHRCPRCGADGQRIVEHPPCPAGREPRRKPGSHERHLGHPGTKHRPRRGSWFVCARCGANGDRDYMAALNIGAEWLAEGAARRAEAGRGKRGRALAEAAAAHRQGVSYRGASVAKLAGTPAHEPFVPQNTWIPILSRLEDTQAGARKTVRTAKGWAYRARGLCGWRGRHVRVTPKPCLARLPVA